MRTITYERFLQRVCGLIGIPRDDLQTDEEAILRQHFNKAIAEIWNLSPWPQVTAIEERTPVSGLIDFEQPGETEIDTVFAIYDNDPYGDTTASTLPYALTDSGIQLTGDLQTSTENVWVYFRKRCPDYNGDEYVAATAYSADDQVYYSTTGDFYRALQSTTGNLPTNTTYWTRLTIPYDFVNYLAHSVYADWLRSEGQNDKAIAQASTAAERALVVELDKLERQQGILPPLVINTHLAAYSQ